MSSPKNDLKKQKNFEDVYRNFITDVSFQQQFQTMKSSSKHIMQETDINNNEVKITYPTLFDKLFTPNNVHLLQFKIENQESVSEIAEKSNKFFQAGKKNNYHNDQIDASFCNLDSEHSKKKYVTRSCALTNALNNSKTHTHNEMFLKPRNNVKWGLRNRRYSSAIELKYNNNKLSKSNLRHENCETSNYYTRSRGSFKYFNFLYYEELLQLYKNKKKFTKQSESKEDNNNFLCLSKQLKKHGTKIPDQKIFLHTNFSKEKCIFEQDDSFVEKNVPKNIIEFEHSNNNKLFKYSNSDCQEKIFETDINADLSFKEEETTYAKLIKSECNIEQKETFQIILKKENNQNSKIQTQNISSNQELTLEPNDLCRAEATEYFSQKNKELRFDDHNMKRDDHNVENCELLSGNQSEKKKLFEEILVDNCVNQEISLKKNKFENFQLDSETQSENKNLIKEILIDKSEESLSTKKENIELEISEKDTDAAFSENSSVKFESLNFENSIEKANNDAIDSKMYSLKTNDKVKISRNPERCTYFDGITCYTFPPGLDVVSFPREIIEKKETKILFENSYSESGSSGIIKRFKNSHQYIQSCEESNSNFSSPMCENFETFRKECVKTDKSIYAAKSNLVHFNTRNKSLSMNPTLKRDHLGNSISSNPTNLDEEIKHERDSEPPTYITKVIGSQNCMNVILQPKPEFKKLLIFVNDALNYNLSNHISEELILNLYVELPVPFSSFFDNVTMLKNNFDVMKLKEIFLDFSVNKVFSDLLKKQISLFILSEKCLIYMKSLHETQGHTLFLLPVKQLNANRYSFTIKCLKTEPSQRSSVNVKAFRIEEKKFRESRQIKSSTKEILKNNVCSVLNKNQPVLREDVSNFMLPKRNKILLDEECTYNKHTINTYNKLEQNYKQQKVYEIIKLKKENQKYDDILHNPKSGDYIPLTSKGTSNFLNVVLKSQRTQNKEVLNGNTEREFEFNWSSMKTKWNEKISNIIKRAFKIQSQSKSENKFEAKYIPIEKQIFHENKLFNISKNETKSVKIIFNETKDNDNLFSKANLKRDLKNSDVENVETLKTKSSHEISNESKQSEANDFKIKSIENLFIPYSTDIKTKIFEENINQRFKLSESSKLSELADIVKIPEVPPKELLTQSFQCPNNSKNNSTDFFQQTFKSILPKTLNQRLNFLKPIETLPALQKYKDVPNHNKDVYKINHINAEKTIIKLTNTNQPKKLKSPLRESCQCEMPSVKFRLNKNKNFEIIPISKKKTKPSLSRHLKTKTKFKQNKHKNVISNIPDTLFKAKEEIDRIENEKPFEQNYFNNRTDNNLFKLFKVDIIRECLVFDNILSSLKTRSKQITYDENQNRVLNEKIPDDVINFILDCT